MFFLVSQRENVYFELLEQVKLKSICMATEARYGLAVSDIEPKGVILSS